MRRRLRNGIAGLGLLAMVGNPFLVQRASAQATERYRVMITNLKPIDDADKGFGRDLANELRDLLNELGTHQPVEEREVRDAADQYDIEYDELDCLQAVRLAILASATAVFCGEVIENREEGTFSLRRGQITAPGSVSFPIPDRTWGRDDAERAAQEIAGALEAYVDQSRRAAVCGEDFESRNWDGAEQNCTAVLAANPDHTQVRFIWANVLMETERLEEAYIETLGVMEADPQQEQALLLSGLLAAAMGMEEEARKRYYDYRVLNPHGQVWMGIAFEMAEAGNPGVAMLLIEEGLDLQPEQLDQAVSMAEQVLETHSEEARFWSDYANLLNRVGRVDDAIAALEETEQHDPNVANIKTRQGNWLVAAGREAEALPYLEQAVENGEQAPTSTGILLSAGFSKGISAEPPDPGYALA